MATDLVLGVTGSAAFKVPCAVVATTNITKSGQVVIGAYTTQEDDRVLQAVSGGHVDNGIWICNAEGAWQRAPDFDGPLDTVTGTLVSVLRGSDGAADYQWWRLTTTGDYTIGDDALTFSQEDLSSTALAASLAASGGATLVGAADSASGTLWTTVQGFINRIISSAGSSVIGFIAAGTGAVLRTLQDKSRDVVTFGDYGASIANADQTSKIQAAIDSGAGVIDGGGLTYRVDSTLTLRSNLLIQNVTFDFSNASTSDTLLDASGTLGSSTAFTAASRGASTFVVSSATGIAAKTWLYLESSNVFGYGMSKNGEFVEVLSIVGTTVTPYRRLQDAYTTTPLFYKPTMLENITLRNVRMIGRGNSYAQIGANFYLCRNVTLDNVRAEWFADRCFNVLRCMDVEVSGIKTAHSDTSTGLAYGIVIGNGCERVAITGGSHKDHRHAISIGAENGVDRYISVTGVTVTDATDGGIDCHPGAQYVTIAGNAVGQSSNVASQDGIVVQCGSATVTGNVVQGFTRIGILMQDLGGTDGPTDTHSVVSSNVVTMPIGSGPLYGIAIENQRVAFGQRITCSGNTVDMGNASVGVGIHCEIVSGGSSVTSAVFSGNNVLARYEALKVVTATNKVLRCLTATGNSFETLGGSSYDVVNLVSTTANYIERGIISGNSIYGGRYGVNLTNCSRIKVDANMIQNWATGATNGTIVGTNDNYTA